MLPRRRVLIAGQGEWLEAMARTFLEDGAIIALMSTAQTDLERVLDALGGEQSDRFGQVVGEGCFEVLVARLGRLDVLVCMPPQAVAGQSLEACLVAQVAGPGALLKAACARMLRHGGRLLAVAPPLSSPLPSQEHHGTAMAQAALGELIQRLALRAPDRVRANLLCPEGSRPDAVAEYARFLAGGAGRALNGQVLHLTD
jgi:NAD(P)-dependent dehydrogenase (short-subunit alcohol dehydrogenase family)